jgi:hypothetical protein
MKLTTHLVPRSRMLEPYLHSSLLLHGIGTVATVPQLRSSSSSLETEPPLPPPPPLSVCPSGAAVATQTHAFVRDVSHTFGCA